jgi:hypothetical protein
MTQENLSLGDFQKDIQSDKLKLKNIISKTSCFSYICDICDFKNDCIICDNTDYIPLYIYGLNIGEINILLERYIKNKNNNLYLFFHNLIRYKNNQLRPNDKIIKFTNKKFYYYFGLMLQSHNYLLQSYHFYKYGYFKFNCYDCGFQMSTIPYTIHQEHLDYYQSSQKSYDIILNCANNNHSESCLFMAKHFTDNNVTNHELNNIDFVYRSSLLGHTPSMFKLACLIRNYVKNNNELAEWNLYMRWFLNSYIISNNISYVSTIILELTKTSALSNLNMQNMKKIEIILKNPIYSVSIKTTINNIIFNSPSHLYQNSLLSSYLKYLIDNNYLQLHDIHKNDFYNFHQNKKNNIINILTKEINVELNSDMAELIYLYL